MEELIQLLEEVNKKHKTYFEPIKIGDKKLYFLQIANMKDYIEKIVETGEKLNLFIGLRYGKVLLFWHICFLKKFKLQLNGLKRV